VLFVGEWSRRRKVDVSGAGAAVDEERSVGFLLYEKQEEP